MEKLEISVDFYDVHHENLFKNYSTYHIIYNLINNKKILINKNEFLTYLLFTEQKDRIGFRSYSDFSNQISKSYALINKYLEFENNSIKANFIGDNMDNNLIERVGVSISLCIVNKIHCLHEADWKKIHEQRGWNSNPTLDFEIASDGNRYIQVECKGSSIEDNRLKNSNVSNHKSNIEHKKENIPEFNNLCYGTISVLDNRQDTVAKCWLLEPPPFEIKMEPEKYRLLSRLYFYWNSLRFASPNSMLLSILINRIRVIEFLKDYKELSGLSLVNRNGDEMELHSNSFANKSVIEHNKIIGKVYPFNRASIFFMGFPQEIYENLISQDFNQILKYKYSSKIEKNTVTCRINKNYIEKYNIPSNLIFKKENYDDYIEFDLAAELNFTESGRVFGVLNFEDQK